MEKNPICNAVLDLTVLNFSLFQIQVGGGGTPIGQRGAEFRLVPLTATSQLADCVYARSGPCDGEKVKSLKIK